MHVECELMGVMADHLMVEHGFRLDPRETILVGLHDEMPFCSKSIIIRKL